MAFPFLAAATLGAGLFSAFSASKSQEKTNEANAALSREQMEFQERMSSTAHQREVADLRAAGLNPVLSANGGASSPGGSMATMVNPDASTSERVLNSARAAAEIQLTKETSKTQQSQQELNRANATKATAEADLARGSINIPGFYRGPSGSLVRGVRGFLSSARAAAAMNIQDIKAAHGTRYLSKDELVA